MISRPWPLCLLVMVLFMNSAGHLMMTGFVQPLPQGWLSKYFLGLKCMFEPVFSPNYMYMLTVCGNSLGTPTRNRHLHIPHMFIVLVFWTAQSCWSLVLMMGCFVAGIKAGYVFFCTLLFVVAMISFLSWQQLLVTIKSGSTAYHMKTKHINSFQLMPLELSLYGVCCRHSNWYS